MSFRILKHALGLIVENFPMAVRITLLPWLFMTFASYATNVVVYGDVLVLPGMEADPEQGIFTALLPIFNFVLTIAISIWIIVGWHRFILRNEISYVYWPEWRGDVTMDYFVRAFFVWLVLIILIVSYAVLGATLLGEDKFSPMYFGGSPISFLVFTTGFSGLFMYVSLRISLGLPAASVGDTMYIKESWIVTKPYNREIFAISIILALAYLPATLITLNYNDVLALVLLVQVLGALHVLLSVTVLTTLYGVLKEGRELS